MFIIPQTCRMLLLKSPLTLSGILYSVSPSKKQRLDQYLVEHHLCESRTKAQALVMAGAIRVNGQRIDQSSHGVGEHDRVELVDSGCPYVSRGGLKLAHALSVFQPTVTDVVAMDVGASTGGFTDCLLQNGARKIYAIDVGYGQLDWRLRQHEQVVVLERTNIRELEADKIQDAIDLVVVDVSFISITKAWPSIWPWLSSQGEAIVLVKPQFEFKDYCEHNSHQKKFQGVVRDSRDWATILNGVGQDIAEQGNPWLPVGLTPSPLQGPKGNHEFLMHLRPQTESALAFNADSWALVVNQAIGTIEAGHQSNEPSA